MVAARRATSLLPGAAASAVLAVVAPTLPFDLTRPPAAAAAAAAAAARDEDNDDGGEGEGAKGLPLLPPPPLEDIVLF